MQLKMQVVTPLAYLSVGFFPLFITAIALFLQPPGGNNSRVAYAVLGGGLTGLWASTYIDAGNSINDDRWAGTLEPLVGSPTPLFVIVLGKLAASVLLGLISILVSLTVAVVGFHRLLPAVDGLPFTISFLLTLVAFCSLVMALAPIFALARWTFTIVNGLEILVFVVCGFMFPTTQLPGWVQAISSLLPPTWPVRAMYAATGQPLGRDYGRWWLFSVLLILAYAVISGLLFRFVEKRARVSGQLALA